jgi:hypothetical protein
MKYEKPEIAVLGEATRVILKKRDSTEVPGSLAEKTISDCELDS